MTAVFRHAGRAIRLAGLVTAVLGTAPVMAQEAARTFAGNVVASDLVGLSYEARACIAEISEEARREGLARAGQVLVRLDAQRTELALRSAQARVADLEAAVEERQLNIDAARADMERRGQEVGFVAREFERNDTMFRRGLINEATMDAVERRMMDANFAADRSKEALASAISAKKRAEIALDIGRLELQRAEVDLESLAIVAPFDGVLVGFDPNVGDCVQDGALAAEIYAPDKKAVEFFVHIDELSETADAGVAIAAPMKITRSSGQACSGVVTWIDTEANLETQYVKASVEVDAACAPDLFLNEAVEVETAGSS